MNMEMIMERNPHIRVLDITDERFCQYGRIVDSYELTDMIAYVKNNTPYPEDGTIYVPSIEHMESMDLCRKISNEFYGGMPIQVGYCNGKNSSLNGLEYHKGSEMDVAVTDLVLLLGRVQDIQGNTYNSELVEAFYMHEGTAVELYATTLHFAPCRVQDQGFKSIIFLPEGTNLPLEYPIYGQGEAELLFMKNKWLIVHPSVQKLIDRGAYSGMNGENIQIRI